MQELNSTHRIRKWKGTDLPASLSLKAIRLIGKNRGAHFSANSSAWTPRTKFCTRGASFIADRLCFDYYALKSSLRIASVRRQELQSVSEYSYEKSQSLWPSPIPGSLKGLSTVRPDFWALYLLWLPDNKLLPFHAIGMTKRSSWQYSA